MDIASNTGTNVGPIRKGRRFTQRIVACDDKLAGVSVYVATYHKQIPSLATFALFDAGGLNLLREEKIDTSGFVDNTWQRIAFEPVTSKRGDTFLFKFETDADGEAITLWTNNQTIEGCRENDQPTSFGAICHKTHYLRSSHALLDPLLSNYVAQTTQPDAFAAEKLHEIIRHCVCRKEYFFLRLAHLLDAFNRTKNVKRVLSIGCGMGYHEAFLATRFPHIEVHALDLKLFKEECKFDLPNLTFFEADIRGIPDGNDYDFVFSIESLEHIEDYTGAFRKMAAQARPGGWFYLSVPFATREEQLDESLKREAWEKSEHYLAGFDFETLESYFASAGYDVQLISNMFECQLAQPVNSLLHAMDIPVIETMLEEIVRLFLLDLKPSRVDSVRRAEGIKVLGQRHQNH